MHCLRSKHILICLIGFVILVAGIQQNEASVFSKIKGVFSSSNNKTNTDNGQLDSKNSSQSYDGPTNNNYPLLNSNQRESQHETPYNVNNNAGYGVQGTRDGDTRIPFWNIAHMVNSIDQVDQMLSNGSNGIEIDVSFNDKGEPSESYHGFPCDCGRHCHFKDNFVDMIRHIASICVPPASSNLQLVLFDLKLSKLDEQKKVVAGEALARILHEHLYNKYAQVARNKRNNAQQSYQQNQNQASSYPNNYQNNLNNNHNQNFMNENSRSPSYNNHENNSRYNNNYDKSHNQPTSRQLEKPPVRVVISINYVNDSSLIRSFMRYVDNNRLDSIKKLVGFDVGMNDKLTNISSMWDNLNGITRNIWQGDGLTNCVNLVRPTDRLRDAISMRNNQGHFRKVYYWTVDVLYQLRSILRLGPDAVLTNQPQRILQVLEEPEFKERYRLATPYDDPFAQYWIEPTASKMSLPTAEDAKETIENVKNTSMNFIKTLPDGISAAVKKVLSKGTSENNNNNNS